MSDTDSIAVLRSLHQNGMGAEYVPLRQTLFTVLEKMIPQGCVTASGSSETLTQLGIRAFLHKRTQYYDAGAAGLSRAEKDAAIRKAFDADIYLTSAAAVTETGELLLVDGTGNRTAAVAYGPHKVIVIVGTNKLVPDFDAALQRLRTVAAPKNALRRGKGSLPCARLGRCINCKSPERMCCDFLRVAFCRENGRITVLLVDEEVGF